MMLNMVQNIIKSNKKPIFKLKIILDTVFPTMTKVDDMTSIDDLYDRASQAHDDDDYKTAKDLYHQVLDIEPEDKYTLRWLADVYLHLEDYENAIVYYERTIDVLRKGLDNIPLDSDETLAEHGVDKADMDIIRIHAGLDLSRFSLKPDRPENTENTDDDRLDDGDFYNDYGLSCYELSYTLRAVGLYVSGLSLEDNATIHSNLGMALYQLYQEGEHEAAQDTAKWWVDTYPDNLDACHIGVAISGGQAPKIANADYVAETFDDFAEEFETKLLNDLDYQAPTLLYKKMQDLFPNGIDTPYRILDAGCGTGLCGSWLRPYANPLIGVDLSPKMLDVARDKKCYDQLDTSELTQWIRENDPCHIAVAADVFCYIGDLSDILMAWSHNSIGGEKSGYLLFTVEYETEPVDGGYVLCPSGRYRHNHTYIEDVLKQSDLKQIALDKVVLRYEYGEPVHGLLVVAQS